MRLYTVWLHPVWFFVCVFVIVISFMCFVCCRLILVVFYVPFSCLFAGKLYSLPFVFVSAVHFWCILFLLRPYARHAYCFHCIVTRVWESCCPLSVLSIMVSTRFFTCFCVGFACAMAVATHSSRFRVVVSVSMCCSCVECLSIRYVLLLSFSTSQLF